MDTREQPFHSPNAPPPYGYPSAQHQQSVPQTYQSNIAPPPAGSTYQSTTALVDPATSSGTSSRRNSAADDEGRPKPAYKTYGIGILIAVLIICGLGIGLGIGLGKSRSSDDNNNLGAGGTTGGQQQGATSSSTGPGGSTNTNPDAGIENEPAIYPVVPTTFSRTASTGPTQVSILIKNQVDSQEEQYDTNGQVLPKGPAQLIVAGGELSFELTLDPPEAVDQMTSLKFWLDNEDQQGVYRLDVQEFLFKYVNSDANLIISNVTSGVHTLHCELLFSDSPNPVFATQELYLLRPRIKILTYRVGSEFLSRSGRLLIQVQTSVPIEYADSDELQTVFPIEFSNARFSPVQSTNATQDGSGRFPKIFSQEFYLYGPGGTAADGIGNMTEGMKTLQIELYSALPPGINQALLQYRYAVLQIQFYFLFRTRSPLTSPIAVPILASPPQPNVPEGDERLDRPTVIDARPLGIIAGNISYLNLTVRGAITDEHSLIVAIRGFSCYLDIPVQTILSFNRPNGLQPVNRRRLFGVPGSTLAQRFQARALLQAGPGPDSEGPGPIIFEPPVSPFDSQPRTTLLVPLSAAQVDDVPINFKFEEVSVAVREASTGTVTPYHRSLASVAPHPSEGGLKVTLQWPTPTDVDLHVTTPGGVEIFYMQPQGDGGQLDVDSNADCELDFIQVENIYFDAPVSGTYTFAANMYKDCENGPSPVTLTIDGCDVEHVVHTGTVPSDLTVTLEVKCESEYTLKGRVLYQSRNGMSGGAIQIRTAGRQLKIKVEEKDTETVVGEAKIKDDGSFEIRLNIEEGHAKEVHVIKVTTESDLFVVMDYDNEAHELQCTDACEFTPKDYDGQYTGSVLIPIDPLFTVADKSGAINIFMVLHLGYDWFTAFGYTLPKTTVFWDLGVRAPGTSDSLSYHKGGILYIGGSARDPDEFDESVLLHEFGHRFQYAFGPVAVGGPHSGGQYIRQTLAFSEGIATYFGQRQLQRQLYVDSSASGGFSYDICDSARWKKATSTGTSRGLIAEKLVTCVLWTLQDRQAIELPMLSHFTKGLKTPTGEQKGEAGFADLADVLSFLSCPLQTADRNQFQFIIGQPQFLLNWTREVDWCFFN